MANHSTPAERRNDRAAGRDDAADQRDHAADQRDHDADQRDHDADERDEYADQDATTLDDLLDEIRHQVLDRSARVEAAAIDPAQWPDLTPAALTRLQAHNAEQRRLAARDRTAVMSLLDQLHSEVRHLRGERLTAAHDRRDSARDRRHAAEDRGHSVADREQSAVERAQLDLDDFPPTASRHRCHLPGRSD